jgi:hypothetical protein
MVPMRLRTVTAFLVVVVALLALGGPYLRSYTRAAALIIGMTGMDGWPAELLGFEADTIAVSEVTVPSRHGALRGRLFVPSHIRRAVVLVPGIHAIGIDEPRLYNLAIQMAQVGMAVLTPEMPDLTRYAITARTTDMIEDAGCWLSHQPRLTRDGRVGMTGISFAGGLATVAAGRPALRDHVAFVFAFGGHSHFPRVLRFLSSGMEPAALPQAGTAAGTAVPERHRRPHDYGVAVLLLGLADRCVPPEQVEPLRAAILEYLTASCYDLINVTKAMETYRNADTMARALPDPSRTLMRCVNTRDVDTLGPLLVPHLAHDGLDPALSPDLSPAPMAPVYLLHGTDDNVVPAIETSYLARYLEGKTRVRVLLSSLITHAELNQKKGWAEAWQLLDFFADLLRE